MGEVDNQFPTGQDPDGGVVQEVVEPGEGRGVDGPADREDQVARAEGTDRERDLVTVPPPGLEGERERHRAAARRRGVTATAGLPTRFVPTVASWVATGRPVTPTRGPRSRGALRRRPKPCVAMTVLLVVLTEME